MWEEAESPGSPNPKQHYSSTSFLTGEEGEAWGVGRLA